MYFLVIKKINMLVGAALVALLAFSLVIYPHEGVTAATAGLKIFWEVVLPSMFPFFVLSELLLGLGGVHFLGVLLESLMRPLFNVPGVGAFALSMGLAAGYPMDAVITSKFRRNKLCTRIEGERLLSFTNTADPLFIFGAVAVGMFGRPDLGAVLGIAHYLSSFTVGIIFKYYRRGEEKEPRGVEPQTSGNLLKRAVAALIKARNEDGRVFGRLLGDAVKESLASLFVIGGFIMLFSVLVTMLELFGIMRLLTPLIGGLLKIFGLDPNLAGAVFSGLLEIDLGTAAVAKAGAPLADRLMVASWIIAWSGLCVHGQVASVIHDTDIRLTPYYIARMLHGILAAAYTWVLLGPLGLVTESWVKEIPMWQGINPLDRIILSGKQMLSILAVLLFAAWLSRIWQRYRVIYVDDMKKSSR